MTPPLAPTPEEQQAANLRGWCEAILCELAGPDMEPSVGVVDQLTQVVECRAKELLAAASATDQQRITELTAENTELLRIINQQADHED